MCDHADAYLTIRTLLESVACRDFRCLEDLVWSPGEGAHLLLGANGTGKTSLLEAIYFLATTKSFRTAKLADCVRWGQPALWTNGRLGGRRPTELQASWQAGGANRSVNGKNAALSDYLGHLPALAWSARDNAFLDGEPRARRRFLDQGLVGKSALTVEVLGQYRRVLAAKRSLLSGASADSLETWNHLLAENGQRVIVERRSYVEELEQAYREVVAQAGIALPEVRFRYRPSPENGASLESFARALRAVESSERETRRVRLGPHRDRLEIVWQGADIGKVASGGERKLFGLLLTAARRRVLSAAGREPLVLLDDLDAALDRRRLVEAWELFRGMSQVLVTSADSGLAQRLAGARQWRFDGARLEPS